MRSVRVGWRLAARVVQGVVAGCLLVAVVVTSGLGVGPAVAAAPVRGLDVSGHQSSIDWAAVRSSGAQFAYVKATEGTGFTNPQFASQYNGSYQAGLIRGAYHFARPDVSSGAAQATFFAGHGGGWSADGRTLPGALDLEPDPPGAQCYGLSPGAMVAWIAGFAAAYHGLTSRWPVIYTTSRWWTACTGGYRGFASQDPLWLAGAAASPPPAGWGTYTFWQYAQGGTFPGDQDIFNGSRAMLRRFAAGA
jgi:GH25 family lysozyme M1 (1,4-beta-N-acetylmuramidase)